VEWRDAARRKVATGHPRMHIPILGCVFWAEGPTANRHSTHTTHTGFTCRRRSRRRHRRSASHRGRHRRSLPKPRSGAPDTGRKGSGRKEPFGTRKDLTAVPFEGDVVVSVCAIAGNAISGPPAKMANINVLTDVIIVFV
jgi:hypothetical protein